MLAAGLLAFGGLAVAAEPEMPGEIRSKYVPRATQRPVATGQSTFGTIVTAQAKDPPKEAPKDLPKDAVPGGDALRPPILGVPARTNQDLFDAYVRLDPPGREKVFGARETEKELEQRFSQLEKDAGRERILFPEKPDLSADAKSATRQMAPSVIYLEPSIVVYRRLYFEEKNAERYGWDTGPVLQPLISTAWFLSDSFWFPKHAASYHERRFDTNAGLCWPGDPVPYLLYPPEFTLPGTLLQTALVIGLFAAIP